MTYKEKIKILGALRTTKVEVGDAYDENRRCATERMIREGFSHDEVDAVCQKLLAERDWVVTKLEDRITIFKQLNDLYQ